MKALEKDRRRYETPTGLANDVAAHLAGEPVQAAPPSKAYRLRKFVRKRRGPLTAAGLVCAAVLVGVGAATWQEFRRRDLAAAVETNRLRAENSERKEELSAARIAEAVARAEAARRESELVREKAEPARREAARSEHAGLTGQVAQEENRRAPGWAERSWELLKRAAALKTPLRSESSLRSAAAAVPVADEYRLAPDWTLEEGVQSLAYSRSGQLLAAGLRSDNLNLSPRLHLLDTATGTVRHRLHCPERPTAVDDVLEFANFHHRSRLESCAFIDSDRAVLAGTQRGRVYRWDLTTDPPTGTFAEVGREPVWIFPTSDGRLCVTQLRTTNELRCWDAATLAPLGEPLKADTDHVHLFPGEPSLPAHSPDGTHWLTLPGWQEKQLFNPHRGAGAFHPSGTFYSAFYGDSSAPSLRAERWSDGTALHDYPTDDGPSRNLDIAASLKRSVWWQYAGSGRVFAMSNIGECGQEVRLWVVGSGSV